MLAAAALAAAALAAALLCAGDGTVGMENKSVVLANSLRRQLMTNNYDYMSSETNNSPVHISRKQFIRTDKKYDHSNERDYDMDDVEEEDEMYSNYRSYKPNKHVKQSEHHVNSNNREEVFDGSDQTYSDPPSIDEDLKRIVRGKKATRRFKKTQHRRVDNGDVSEEESRNENVYTNNPLGNQNNDDTTTALYKILRKKKSYRRSGGPTLIQEETADAVSVVNLGEGPFPQFRLPASRRQYMRSAGDGGLGENEQELPPPAPLEDNIPDATDILNPFVENNTITQSKSSNAQIAATDEIFVL